MAYVGHEEDDDERCDGLGHTAHQRVQHADLTIHHGIHPHSILSHICLKCQAMCLRAFGIIFAFNTPGERRTGISMYEGILQTYSDQQELCRLVDLVQECRQEARHIDNLIHVAINPISPPRLARHPVAYRLDYIFSLVCMYRPLGCLGHHLQVDWLPLSASNLHEVIIKYGTRVIERQHQAMAETRHYVHHCETAVTRVKMEHHHFSVKILAILTIARVDPQRILNLQHA